MIRVIAQAVNMLIVMGLRPLGGVSGRLLRSPTQVYSLNEAKQATIAYIPYKKPDLKAPAFQPGDEKSFLVWGSGRENRYHGTMYVL